ncbi:MAG: lysylphosphatidylglycerol synthase domain-containing protein [Candidatus Binataceae bacterium]
MSAEVATTSASAPPWRRAVPYLGSLVIFAVIFWRIPFREVWTALAGASPLAFVGVFLPYSIFYFLIDSACLTWVVNRFNTRVRYRDILPVRASMYLLALINTNHGQGGVAYYLYRKFGIGFLAALGSILFIALLEVYQLFLFSTIGVAFHTSAPGTTQEQIVAALRIAYVVAWLLLAAIMVLFAIARRRGRMREWIETSRFGAIAGSFLKAHPLDYLTVLAIKAPTLLGSIVAHYFALRLFGISIPMVELLLFLPLVFLAAALPIAVAHLGTSQAAWLLFFAGSASNARILAYSLAAHFTFMLCNGLLGLCFLPRASRELTALEPAPSALQATPARGALDEAG